MHVMPRSALIPRTQQGLGLALRSAKTAWRKLQDRILEADLRRSAVPHLWSPAVKARHIALRFAGSHERVAIDDAHFSASEPY